MGFFRQEYWSGLPFPSLGNLPNPGIKLRPPALQADSLLSEPLGKVEKKEKKSEVAQSCPTLCHPVDCSLLGSSLHGILQARVLEWVTISFSRGSSRPRSGGGSGLRCLRKSQGAESHLRWRGWPEGLWGPGLCGECGVSVE